MDQVKIGAFMKQLRKEKGLTQAQVAEKFGTTDRTVSRWETGVNMPDISLLVEISELYGVDVRELIEGERRREDMDSEVKEVAEAMAEYAGEEKSTMLKWMRGISIVGVVVSFLLMIWQVSSLSLAKGDGGTGGTLMYKGVGFIGILALFVIMVIIALYTNGLLARIASNKRFTKSVKVVVIVISVLAAYEFIKCAVIIGSVLFVESLPSNDVVLDTYNKEEIVDQYRGDIDSSLFLFPDDISAAESSSFEGKLHTGLFDTDGYIRLVCRYSPDEYLAEKERLGSTSCTLTYEGVASTKNVYLDESSYRLPAYVAVDGYDYSYEYALCDDDLCEITYLYLGYVDSELIAVIGDDLKIDKSVYADTGDNTLERFSIYAYYFGDGAAEYGD